MTTHLSARLAWHDRGWDGRICDAPHLNAHCIVHQHIRDSREDDKERGAAGTPLAELDGWLPPCSRDPATYADRGFVIVHRDPLEFRKLPSVSEDIPPYSSCPAPYRWMREEFFQEVCEAEDLSIRGPDEPRSNGWVFEPDRQRELLKRFWGKLEPEDSLIFYYCNHGNPLDENTPRIVVGVGRVAEVGPQLYFGTTPKYQDQYPVWSRRITQAYPDQGVRIPYQEYLRRGHPTDDIICRVPRNALLPFSYGGEHVSDDVAVAILERVIQCVERVGADGHVAGDWERRLAWLNDALAQAWSGRGPFPGAGSVLQYLGFSKGTSFQRAVIASMAKQGENPWDYVLSILEGRVEPDGGPYKAGLLKARERWGLLKSRQALLSKLARFELSPGQVQRIANPDQRAASGIDATEEALVGNPYILAESDLGAVDSDPVALETIDHGLRPEGNAALFPDDDEVSHDDRRRVRAVGVAVLQEAAGSGDTVLTFGDFLNRIIERFPERRACRPDREIVVAGADFYQRLLWMALDSDPEMVALKHLQSLEQRIASLITRRAKKVNPAADPPIDWLAALKGLFGEPESDRARVALEEKQVGLGTLFSRRLSVLTGGAGTGKTSVLKVFLQELVRAEGRHPTLLLAPTGKARVRLSTKTERNAMTIHQFLLKQGWFVPDIFALKAESDQSPYQATTVIIDECSMIPTDLFGTLLHALDSGPLSRLILVGDPNQLPPIGPGRPFADIIDWLQKEHPDCIAPLSVCMRTDEEEGAPAEDSVALALADGYRASVVSPGDDEILAAAARGESKGDLEVVFWDDHDELLAKLRGRMAELLGIRDDDYQSFNRSLGIDTKDWVRSETWQILSPTRAQHFGTDDLNRLIQMEYKGGLIANAKNPWSKVPRPFGDQEIVYTDKVIQVVNRSIKGWPRDTGLDYVANGEIGIVRNTTKGDRGDYLDAVFSTQPEVSYRYFRKQVDDNLDLAYALTVHKAQGSDFEVVFLIIPQKASTLSRELIYTGLTRFRRKLVLLIEKDIEPLRRLRSPDCSDTRLRNTHMFTLALRPDEVKRPHLEALIHRTRKGVAVRSKSEVVVADVLDALEISYAYEQPLYSRSDPKDFRLPDFTASFEGDVYYWEHLGMLSVPSYREAWERKRQWYEDNGYADRLITSEDGPDGSIDAARIERIAREKIRNE
ncbi:MAG: AAA family ATPase [Candidatus Rokubacteria bacterium]|nr:AAA family ATPase [Candidatus Rokubacteria bacterium]